jgi:membrane-bound lytic murein transglycosylase MltF
MPRPRDGSRLPAVAVNCTVLLLAIAVALQLAACSRAPADLRSQLPPRLRVLVQEDDAFYSRNETGDWVGFNQELIERLRRHVALPVEIKSFAGTDALRRAFDAGEGDIMCPALTITRASAAPAALTDPAQPRLPTLRFKVSDDEDFAWVLRPDLASAAPLLEAWLRTTSSQLFVANLYAKYFAHLGLTNNFDLVMLKVRYQRDLPRYRALFEEAGRRHDIDPLFLAAMSYQESHWNPRARSHTGVRGLMMLTQDTADQLGVKNRLDPRQSVLGGTRYLMQIRGQIGDAVGRPDNNYYALAAYNVGLGHVQDAQEIVKRRGGDETLWTNLRGALPLLSEPQYYTTLRFGKARGQEPVRYVDSIRSYYALLSKVDAAARRTAAATSTRGL